jgi:hypothetical protein
VIQVMIEEAVTINKYAKANERHVASYADFVIASFLYYIRRVDQKSYDGMLLVDQAFSELVEACEPWFKKDD